MTLPFDGARRPIAITAIEKILCSFIVLGTLIYYWAIFFSHAVNIGQADDFVDVLWFIEIFLSREHWQEWFAVIALPNHEHVTLLNHLVYLLDYALFKKINFFHYLLLGHVVVLACCWVLAEWLSRSLGWWYAWALAIGLFVNLFYWDASFWAVTAISNQVVVLFSLLAARGAGKKSSAIFLPLGWSLLAISSQFNGLLILPALLVGSILVAYSERKSQNWHQLSIWLLSFIVTTALYFFYENPFASDHLWRYVQYTDPSHLQDYIKPSYGNPVSPWSALWQAFLSWFAVLGATVFDLKQWMPAVMVGVLLLGFLIRDGVLGAVKNDRFFMVVLIFVLASLALVAVGRGHAFGVEAGLVYRYRLYSSLLLVLLAGSWLQRCAQHRWRYGLLLGCVLFQCASWRVLGDIEQDISQVKTSYYNWLVDGGMGRSQMPFYPHNQDWRLFNAYHQGYYNPYDAIDSKYKPVALVAAPVDECARLPNDVTEALIQTYSKKSRALAVELRLAIPAPSSPAVFLFCGQSAYRMTLDVRNINPITRQYEPVLVLKDQLPPSAYRVFLLRGNAAAQAIGVVRFL